MTYTPTGTTQADATLQNEFTLSMASCANFDWNGYQTPPSDETSFTHNVQPPNTAGGESIVPLTAPTGYPEGEAACAEAAEVKYYYKEVGTDNWIEVAAGSAEEAFLLGVPTETTDDAGVTSQEWTFEPGTWTHGDVPSVT